MKRKRRSGHYCWACDRSRPNEKFSGRGHARHLCKECARLGTAELDYRQAMRDLDRLLTWEGHIPRRRRAQFEKLLNHENARVRVRALELEMADVWAQSEQRLHQDLDALFVELEGEELEGQGEVGLPADFDDADDLSIPF